MVVYYASSSGRNELYHHGIKGMHWHERRFQNKDGSLTPAGRVRYGVGQAARATGAGISKVARAIGRGAGKAASGIGGAVKNKVAEKKAADRAKVVGKLTATKQDLAKNYDKLTPEERRAALEKFKFQDDLNDSMKKDWQRKVDYAKMAFDAIDTGKKIGDDISLIATGKNLADLAKDRNKDPNSKDKEYWEKENARAKALLTMENAEKLRLQNKAQNDGDVDTYSSGARDKLNRDAAEKAKAEKQQKRDAAIQKFNEAVTKGADAVDAAIDKTKETATKAADKAKDTYEKVAPKVKSAAEDVYNYSGEAVGKASLAFYKGVNKAAAKGKDLAEDAYNYSGEAVGKASTAFYKKVNETAPKIKSAAQDAYNYSGEAVGKASKAVYNGVNSAAAKGKEAASSAAKLTKAKAKSLYESAGSMAKAAEKAGCSPSTIRNFLGKMGKKESKTSMSMRIKLVSPEEYEKHGRSNNIDDYTEDRLRKNQEMIDNGMEILNDILKHDGLGDDELAHYGVPGMKWYKHVAAKTGPSAHSGTSAEQRHTAPTTSISVGGGGGSFAVDPDEEERAIDDLEGDISKLEESIRRLSAVPGQEGIVSSIQAEIQNKRNEIQSRRKRLSELKSMDSAQGEQMRHSFDEEEVASLFSGATFFV